MENNNQKEEYYNDITDEHTLYIFTNNATKEEIYEYFHVDFEKAQKEHGIKDISFRVNAVVNKDGESLGFAF